MNVWKEMTGLSRKSVRSFSFNLFACSLRVMIDMNIIECFQTPQLIEVKCNTNV